MEHRKTKQEESQGQRLGLIMFLYLLGLFIGALSTGIITPVRTIIQNDLGVNDQTGIWTITIFTLCYAAIIPIAGKMADRFGRKYIYIISISLFGVGSVICGLSQGVHSFSLLLCGRVVQAVGAGGIMPIATAEFGTSFPEEKRGMALGLVGGVFGIANVIGATAGSAVLDIFGTSLWQWIFYINLPLCLLIVIGSIFIIPNHKGKVLGKIDKLGTLVMTLLILAVLYGLKNIDFFDFFHSLKQTDVYPFLLAAFILIPLFILIEKRAEDPIFHIEYLKNSQIMLTLAMGFLIGASMMGMIFIPQFAENALKIPTGSGGYFVLILGFFAGAASPISGVIIDKIGAKPVLGGGFLISIAGCLYLAFVATKYLSLLHVVVSLTLIGLGMGLAMGTPLNYMMLRHTEDEESNSALATLSLIRSIGTAIAPAIMIGFIVQASMGLQGDLMKAMPEIPATPEMAQQEELDTILEQLKGTNDEVDKMLDSMDLEAMSAAPISMDSVSDNSKLPKDLLTKMQSADVTTIVSCTKEMAAYMFEENTPAVITEIQAGIHQGILGIGDGISGVSDGISQMESGVKEMDTAKAKLSKGLRGISQGINGMEAGLAQQNKAIEAINKAMQGGGSIDAMPASSTSAIPLLSEENSENGETAPEAPETQPPATEPEAPATPAEPTTPAEPQQPQPPMDPEIMRAKLDQLTAARDQLSAKLADTKNQRAQMQAALSKIENGQKELRSAIAKAKEQRDLMVTAQSLMISMRDEIPTAFEAIEAQYLKDIDRDSTKIQRVFQKDLNKGFRNMYLCAAAFNALAFILLLFYQGDKRKAKKKGTPGLNITKEKKEDLL